MLIKYELQLSGCIMLVRLSLVQFSVGLVVVQL